MDGCFSSAGARAFFGSEELALSPAHAAQCSGTEARVAVQGPRFPRQKKSIAYTAIVSDSTLYDDDIYLWSQQMRRLIDLDREWRTATRIADLKLRTHGRGLAPSVPKNSPDKLADRTVENLDPETLLARLSSADSKPRQP